MSSRRRGANMSTAAGVNVELQIAQEEGIPYLRSTANAFFLTAQARAAETSEALKIVSEAHARL